MKKITSALLILTIMFSGISVSAAKIGDKEITSQGAFVLDYYTGHEIYGHNADTPRPSASMTKLMSLYIVLEAIHKGEISYNTETKISQNVYNLAADNEYQGALATDYNIVYRVDELIDVALVYSACDATLALAEIVSGTEEAFVQRMNETAQRMGLNAQFNDCSGIGENMISPKSVAMLSANLIKDYPEILELASQPSVSFHGKTYKNTNKLLNTYAGTDGLKTGTTSAAGYCFCGTSSKNGERIIAVTMASSTGANRFTDVEKMFDYGFSALEYKRTLYTIPMTSYINDAQIPCFYTNEFGGCGVIIAEDLVNYGYDSYYDSSSETLYLTYNSQKPFTPIPMDYYNGLEKNQPFMKAIPKNRKVIIQKGDKAFTCERVLTLDGYIAIGIDELQEVCDSFFYSSDENHIKISY